MAIATRGIWGGREHLLDELWSNRFNRLPRRAQHRRLPPRRVPLRAVGRISVPVGRIRSRADENRTGGPRRGFGVKVEG